MYTASVPSGGATPDRVARASHGSKAGASGTQPLVPTTPSANCGVYTMRAMWMPVVRSGTVSPAAAPSEVLWVYDSGGSTPPAAEPSGGGTCTEMWLAYGSPPSAS